MLSPALTHGVAALLHGPNGASPLHAAAQSPALLQILKGQRPQAMESELEPWERGAEADGGQVCEQNTHAVAPGEDRLEEVVQEAVQGP